MRPLSLGIVVFCGLLSLSAQANVVGADTQNFNPVTNGLDFVTVHSSETLKPGLLNFGFFLNSAVNTLPNYQSSTASRTAFSDNLLSADFNFGVGLARRWDFGVSFPQMIHQYVASDLERSQFEQAGLTEIRWNTKWRFWKSFNSAMALIYSMNWNQIENNPFAGEDPGPTANIEWSYDQQLGVWAWAVNAGFRYRQPGDGIAGQPVEPLGHQWVSSAALNYFVRSWNTRIIGEIFGSLPAEPVENTTDRQVSSLEALLGVKTSVTQGLAVHFGGGTELIHGTSSPDWRLYGGVNFNLGPVWNKPTKAFVKVEEEQSSYEAVSAPEWDQDSFVYTPGQGKETFIAKDVLFKFNSAEILRDFHESLDRLAEYLRQHGGFEKLIIEGHTDSIGNFTFNQELSLKRAQRVKQELVRRGLAANKIVARGIGESDPLADNGNFQGRAINRRVEFNIKR